MTEVKIYGSVHFLLEIVEEIRESGYKQGIDFDFSFVPAKWEDTLSFSPSSKSHAVFIFYKDLLASFIMLKYGNNE